MAPTISFAAETSTTQRRSSIYTAPQKKQKMSITQTYFLAHSARGKLSKEASRADHDLRLLVGHANMLDSLMIDLANAEQEQERWFNRSLTGAREQEEELTHEETIMEEPEVDWIAEDAESSDESDAEEEDEEDDEEDDSLILTRTVSRHSPPQLAMDSDSESEDEQMPPSPPNLSLDSFTSPKDLSKAQFGSDDFYLASRQQPTIIAAY